MSWLPAERITLEGELSAEEARVLGCLVEKAAATPEYYPLTLNALVTACNQSSNRDPVVAYDPSVVTEALDDLRGRKLVRIVHSQSGRAPKYRHVLDESLGLDHAERAIVAVLMLRGPQTVGELRTRTERLHAFETIADVEAVLDRLARHDPQPLVMLLERQPGQKEPRWAHLLSGRPDPAAWAPSAGGAARAAAGAGGRSALVERLDALEEQVATLTAELSSLRQAHDELRSQLGA
jgi:uncharacterized protein YceH (UPF0502 family)